MGYTDYPTARLADIKIRAARIAALPMDELAALNKADQAVVAALDDGLRLACDELDVQTDITRERMQR